MNILFASDPIYPEPEAFAHLPIPYLTLTYVTELHKSTVKTLSANLNYANFSLNFLLFSRSMVD